MLHDENTRGAYAFILLFIRYDKFLNRTMSRLKLSHQKSTEEFDLWELLGEFKEWMFYKDEL